MTYAEQHAHDEPSTSVYQRAVDALRIISTAGFTNDSRLEDGNHGFFMKIDEEDKPMARLVVSAARIAAEAVPPIPMQASVVEDDQELQLQLLFDRSLEKPPVRALRSYLDKAKNYFINECVVKDTDGPGYYICNPRKLPMDPTELALSFIEPGEPHFCLYRTPPGVVFTDRRGQRHDGSKLVNDDTMKDFLKQFRPDLTLDRLQPAEVLIGPDTMSRIIDQLGLGPAKGSYRN